MPDPATFKAWAEALLAIVGVAMAVLVPVSSWWREERTHRVQRENDRVRAQSAKLTPGAGLQPMAALYIDQQSVERILRAVEEGKFLGERTLVALQRLGLQLERNTTALEHMADKAERVAEVMEDEGEKGT